MTDVTAVGIVTVRRKEEYKGALARQKGRQGERSYAAEGRIEGAIGCAKLITNRRNKEEGEASNPIGRITRYNLL